MRQASRVLFCSLVLPLAQAQSDLPVPPLPATLVAATDAGAEGVSVQVVDAITGAPVGDATFRWVQAPPKTAAGTYLLGSGAHWFEASSPDCISRRDSISVTTRHPAGVLRVPLLPKIVFLRGEVTPPVDCVVEVPAAIAAAPLFPASVATGHSGRFLVAVRDTGGDVELSARVLAKTIAVRVSTANRQSIKVPPHQAIPVVDFVQQLELDQKETAAVAFTLTRLAARSRFGNKSWKRAVEDGLAWLAAHQDADGRWDADGFMQCDTKGTPCTGAGQSYFDAGVTGLALMAFLGDGHTPVSGTYCQTVQRGVEWLLRQRIEDNVIHATDAEFRATAFFYQHCIATIALCEAHVAGGAVEAWQEPIQSAVDYIHKHRNPYGCWRYQKMGGDNDVSATLWATLAVLAARDAGFQGDCKTPLQYVAPYLDEMTDASGRTGYMTKGSVSARLSEAHATAFPADRSEALTAAALLMRFAMGQDPKSSPMIPLGVQLLGKKPPAWKPDALDFYYWSLGMQAAWLAGGPTWDAWSKAVADAVLKHQRKDENARGSWDPDDAWGGEGGRVYSTAMLLLGLQSPWRLQRR